jgi:hypothetical protein
MKKIISLLIIAMLLSACATAKSRSVSFRPPQDFVNYNNISGLKVGAEVFDDTKLAEEAFGFDIRAAGLLPVQVVMNNRSGQVVEVVADQTFLIDDNNRYWKVLSNREVAERFQKAADGGAITGGIAKNAVPGASAGALLGMTFGVVSRGDAGSAIVKGGTSGGAGDAAAGGVGKAGDDRQREIKIADDLWNKGIDGKVLLEETLASGMVYFPGEVTFAKELRLQVKFRGDKRFKTLNLKLN